MIDKIWNIKSKKIKEEPEPRSATKPTAKSKTKQEK